MSTFTLEEARELGEQARQLADRLLPLEAQFARTNVVPPQAQAAFRELGYYGLRLPEAFGGLALGMLPTVHVVRELGRLPPQFWSFLRVALGPSSKSLVRHGSDAQKRRWLPAIGSGECGVAFVLTEPDAGSDLAAMRTRAVRSGDGYILNGTKTYISNADKASLFVVFARTSTEGGLKSALSAFLVPAGRPGITVGPPMPTMGTTLDGLFEVTFQDCHLGRDSLLGEEGQGFQHAMESLNEGRLNVAAIAIGMGTLALELALDHVQLRKVGGQALGSQQAVQHMLANAAMELHAGWLMVIDAARRVDEGEDASTPSAMAKVYCSEAAGRAADMAVQLFGAAGYTRGFAAERIYRDVRVLRIYEGASEILRNAVARRLLKDGRLAT